MVRFPPARAAMAMGRSSFERWISFLRASRRTTGMNNETVAISLTKPDRTPGTRELIKVNRLRLPPAMSFKRSAIQRTTPLRTNPALNINKPAIAMTASLLKPFRTSSTSNTPVAASETSTNTATISARIQPVINNSMEVPKYGKNHPDFHGHIIYPPDLPWANIKQG
jgi:hypothetical protein